MHVIGNWKLNGSAALVDRLAPALNAAAQAAADVAVVACPPDVWLGYLQAALGHTSPVLTGAQTCHSQNSGAFTGESSAAHLAEVGARYVILGHSERRALFGETSAGVALKAALACDQGLRPVVCVGETWAQREAGADAAKAVCAEQVTTSLRGLVGGWLRGALVAYEPVWAIGTGRVAGTQDVAQMSAHLRTTLVEHFGADGEAVEILYGGSVNADNAAEIFSHGGVQGALVGGASLKPEAFATIIAAAQGAP